MSLLIGGVQGEGVISTAENLMKTLSSLGYYCFEKRNFSSRIKGGNSSIVINIGLEKKLWVEDEVSFIVALDQETIDLYHPLLEENGIIFYDSTITPDPTLLKKGLKLHALPISEIAKKNGSLIMKNTSAMGFIGVLLGISEGNLIEVITKKFKKKGQDIIEKNIKVLDHVFQHANENLNEYSNFILNSIQKNKRPLMLGNHGVSLGALMAGCRFVASYPITPASEIMETLGVLLPKYKGIMLQVEDEIAAVNMIIGAAYGGVRSMTATSGPGISLMMEGIGLAGMTETPIVIVNSQRVGPSTGMPTKHEQSDLIGLYFGGHGEYPTIILTPSTVEECFYSTIRAFNLADKYQCPVIILLDLTLSLSNQTIDQLDYSKIEIDRGKIFGASEIQQGYKRFQFTEDHVSTRAIPGTKGGIHHTTGLEHSEIGLPMDTPLNRKKMMEKRMEKTYILQSSNEIIIKENKPTSNNNVLVLTFGSTYGIIKGAIEKNNIPVDFGYFQMIKPLPIKQLENLFAKYDHIIVVENNYSQQLATIIRSEVGYHDKIHSVTKYDGTTFTLGEIITEIGRWV